MFPTNQPQGARRWRSDAIVFSSESHSALEDEKSEDVCDLQDEFEGSMSAVQEILVVKD